MARQLLTPNVTYQLVQQDPPRFTPLAYGFTSLESVRNEILEVQRWLLLEAFNDKARPPVGKVNLQRPANSWAAITTVEAFVDRAREMIRDNPGPLRYVKANCLRFDAGDPLRDPPNPEPPVAGQFQPDIGTFTLHAVNSVIGVNWTQWIHTHMTQEHWALRDSYAPPAAGEVVEWIPGRSFDEFKSIIDGSWAQGDPVGYFVARCAYWDNEVPTGEPGNPLL